MLIKNITDKGAPKPIGIGSVVIMPGESFDVPDEMAYVDEFDKAGRKTGKKIVVPAITLLAGMNQITFEEKKVRKTAKPVVEEAEEVHEELNAEKAVQEEKPKRGRKKAVAE